MRKKKQDPSMVNCSKYNISFPFLTDILTDPDKKIHRVVFTPCPVSECDGKDKGGSRCIFWASPERDDDEEGEFHP